VVTRLNPGEDGAGHVECDSRSNGAPAIFEGAVKV